MKTKLVRFKVRNFRSIEETDWIEVSGNNCLIGTNESGKTNLLIALWKLNPANNEPIVPLDDFPRHLYSNFKEEGHEKDIFISAEFALSKELQSEVAHKLQVEVEQIKAVLVEKTYENKYQVSFPRPKVDALSPSRLVELFERFELSLRQFDAFKREKETLQELITKELQKRRSSLAALEEVNSDILAEILRSLKDHIAEHHGKKKNLPEFFEEHLLTPLSRFINALNGEPIKVNSEMSKKIFSQIPKFVYYSDYGNLDSEIYLPRVIEDFEREDLSESARAKARTLNVLFKYVNLSPQEIYELGNDRKIIVKKVDQRNNVISTEEQDLTSSEITEWAEKKRERGVLLRSAASQLTSSFKKWWLQGDYIFSFEADGHHFRINVSDKLRPESIELEGRSRGLQWFFSFFLVFLVETKGEHSNSILLLDEPGLSLHPIAQYDLVNFFRKLSEDNQLIYTSHSPFLVDMDNLANVKVVYVDSESGRTKVSSNLRYNEKDAEKSIYPVHAALGLTVSDTLLLGCLPVLVEGPSDQFYLSIIKRYLMGQGLIQNTKEIVFIQTGGIRGMGPVTKLVTSRDDELPFIVLDSDKPGRDYAKQLKKDRYNGQEHKILEVTDFIGDDEFEIEDLLPSSAIIEVLDRTFRCETFFEDYYTQGKPIVNQIESWARKNGLQLDQGWKVEIARAVHNRFDKYITNIDGALVNKWSSLFERLLKA